MNDLTKQVVLKAIKNNPGLAKRNNDEFRFKVRSIWWAEIIDRIGVEKKLRAERLLQSWYPELFEDGYFKSYIPGIHDIDLEISRRIVKIIDRKIERDPSLQLDDDWKDFVDKKVNPQMTLF